MRFSAKLVILVVCALTVSAFGAGKASKEAKMTVKDANTPVKETAPAAKEAIPAPSEAKKAEPAVEPKPAEAPTPVMTPADANANKEVAVTVNGINITEGEIDVKIKPVLEKVAGRMDPNSVEMYKKRVRPQALESMIMEQLLNDQVTKAGITVTDEDVNKMISEMTQQRGMSIEDFKRMLQAQGQSFEQFAQQMKPRVGYEKLLEKQMGAIEVNDADALAFYNENKDDFNNPDVEVRASHILVKISPAATPEEKAAAKEKAEALLKRVKAGEDFATLAKENSDDPGSKVKGGDLDFFGKGMMVKEFEEAAFKLEPNHVSDLVETQFGYHIIKVTDRKEPGLTPFDKVKAEIIEDLKDTKKQKLAQEYIGKLKADAKIVYPAGKEPMPQMPPRPMPPRPAPPKPAEVNAAPVPN